MLPEEKLQEVVELNVLTTILAIQIVDKSLSRGIITGPELKAVSDLRTALVEGMEKSIEVNYDQMVAYMQAKAQQEAQAQQAQQEEEEEVEAEEVEEPVKQKKASRPKKSKR